MSSFAWVGLAFVVLTVGGGTVMFHARANKLRYGLVIGKRILPGYATGIGNINTRASIMMGEYYAPIPERHQLKLQRAGGESGWVDVGRDEYDRTAVGDYWSL